MTQSQTRTNIQITTSTGEGPTGRKLENEPRFVAHLYVPQLHMQSAAFLRYLELPMTSQAFQACACWRRPAAQQRREKNAPVIWLLPQIATDDVIGIGDFPLIRSQAAVCLFVDELREITVDPQELRLDGLIARVFSFVLAEPVVVKAVALNLDHASLGLVSRSDPHALRCRQLQLESRQDVTRPIEGLKLLSQLVIEIGVRPFIAQTFPKPRQYSVGLLSQPSELNAKNDLPYGGILERNACLASLF